MQLQWLDVVAFVAFFAAVLTLALRMSKRKPGDDEQAYFLASRGLTWPLIGISIVAANISTEQMVGMAGQGAGEVGLAVSLWQLSGSVGIVLIAFTLLPKFLKAGIYTMPEFLEYRYDSTTRAIMALITVAVYVLVLLTAVLYSGGITLRAICDVNLTTSIWIIGAIAAIYTTWGGLAAVAWADLIQGLGLIAGGATAFLLGLHACGGWRAFADENSELLHVVLPASDPNLPWTGVVSGMGIVILYYCGLNQFIVQRNLAARSLHHGQMGMVFAGALWLLIPFTVVMPGMMARSLYGEELAEQADVANAESLALYGAGRQRPAAEPHIVLQPDKAWRSRFPRQAAELDGHNQAVQSAAQETGQPIESRVLIGYKYDAAFPTLIRNLIPAGLRGLLFAAIAGAVISTLASLLNSAATIVTLDVYKRMLNPQASHAALVWLGRLLTLAFVTIGCAFAPALDDPQFQGVFQFIQQFQGYVWPGVVAAFLMGFLMKRTPPAAANLALVGGPVLYGVFQFASSLHFLIQVALTFGILCLAMAIVTRVTPLPEPRTLPERADLELRNSPTALLCGALVIAGVLVFLVAFW